MKKLSNDDSEVYWPQSLAGFLDSQDRNLWIKEGCIEVYVRKSRRVRDGVWYEALDVANLTSDKPGSGSLANVMLYIEENAKAANRQCIFVENVINDRLIGWLERHGYTTWDNREHLPCYWKSL